MAGRCTGLLSGKFLGTRIVADPSCAVAFTQDRSVNTLLQVFHKLVESRLGNIVRGGLKLALDVLEDDRVAESSGATAKPGVGLAEAVITFDQISDVVSLHEVPSNRTSRIFGWLTGPSAAMNLIDGCVHAALNGAVRDRGNVLAVYEEPQRTAREDTHNDASLKENQCAPAFVRASGSMVVVPSSSFFV